MSLGAPTKSAAGRRGDTVSNLLRLAGLLFSGGEVTTRLIRERFNVSRATAKRYLLLLETTLPVEVLEEKVASGYYSPRKVMRLLPDAVPRSATFMGRAGAPALRSLHATTGARPGR